MSAAKSILLWPEACEHNVEMAHGRPRIDVYLPTGQGDGGGKPRAAIVILPGGGYNMNAAHEGGPFAELCAAHGMVGIVCWYRVKPHGWPAPYADAARAIRLVRSMAGELNVDPDRVGLLGFSAGGHNASTVATQPDLHHDPHDDLVDRFSARPDRLMLAYPVISFVNYGHMGSCGGLLGADVSFARRQQFSNELQVTADNPPTFLFHTNEDAGVPAENTLGFAMALRAKGVPVEVHVFQPGTHGLGMAADHPRLRVWPELMLDWLGDWRG